MKLTTRWTWVLMATMCHFSWAAAPNNQPSQWVLDKQSDNITIYTKHIEGSDVDAFKGVTTLPASRNSILAIMEDTEALAQWMPDVISAELLFHEGNTKIQYVQTDIPWPGKNRDGAYQLTLEESDTQTTILIWAVPEYLEPNPKFVRIPYAKGFWQLSDVEKGTRVVYQLHAEPGGKLPAWLINKFVTDTPFQALSNLATQTSEKGTEYEN